MRDFMPCGGDRQLPPWVGAKHGSIVRAWTAGPQTQQFSQTNIWEVHCALTQIELRLQCRLQKKTLSANVQRPIFLDVTHIYNCRLVPWHAVLRSFFAKEVYVLNVQMLGSGVYKSTYLKVSFFNPLAAADDNCHVSCADSVTPDQPANQ